MSMGSQSFLMLFFLNARILSNCTQTNILFRYFITENFICTCAEKFNSCQNKCTFVSLYWKCQSQYNIIKAKSSVTTASGSEADISIVHVENKTCSYYNQPFFHLVLHLEQVLKKLFLYLFFFHHFWFFVHCNLSKSHYVNFWKLNNKCFSQPEQL